MRVSRDNAAADAHDHARADDEHEHLLTPNPAHAPIRSQIMGDIRDNGSRPEPIANTIGTVDRLVARSFASPTRPSRAPSTSLSTSARPRSPILALQSRRPRSRSRQSDPWMCSPLTVSCSAIALSLLALIAYAFTSTPPDNPKGCRMSYMRANFVPFRNFDTEYTRFATKYSLYLYREGGIDDDPRVKGIPVLFIPGNAGSYKQVRPIAAESAYHHHNSIQHDPLLRAAGKRPLDFFTVDFNEDITAFHGQTLLEQADYLNDAVAFILSLYTDPNRALRDSALPDPTSVIVVGHSMGGVVARTMLTRPKYVANSINTILTLSAPHIRPPVSFDSDMVSIYNDINDYWKRSYAQQWASRNPLWHVTLVSIAGGGLDTVVPSDYASLHSLVPETHGFTVFTSTIPHVWTGMDHLAIMWCDQFRKSLVKALYDVVNVNRPTQTIPRSERMRAFRQRFLTGMEPGVEKRLAHEHGALMTLSPADSPVVLAADRRLDVLGLGKPNQNRVYVMRFPVGHAGPRRFSLLSDQLINPNGPLDVRFCSIEPDRGGFPAELTDPISLSCRSAHVDTIAIPPSTNGTRGYSDEVTPFSHLSYAMDELGDFQVAIVVDRSSEPNNGWIVAEFSDSQDAEILIDQPLETILLQGVRKTLPASGPFVTTLRIPAVHSSLLSYRLDISQKCDPDEVKFPPLVRQYTIDPHESRYFINPSSLSINLHSTSPYLPPPAIHKANGGLSLQIWTDPTCQGPTDVSLRSDVLGSAGQLYMRYRTAFGAFPTLVIALVLRKQFTIYNKTGVFVTFSAAMDQCIRTSLPLIFMALTFLALSLTTKGSLSLRGQSVDDRGDALGLFSRTHGNDLLLGFHDRFFWFLIPLFGVVSVGVCIAANYVILIASSAIAVGCEAMRALASLQKSGLKTPLEVSSPVKRLITTGVLLTLVATLIPYQFAYVVLCIVQLATCVRAQSAVRSTSSRTATNFHAYAHSLLVLMIWILPINLPVLIVWINNLAVHWLTPFSSHHNILSILPFIFLVETLSTGRMIPRMAVSCPAESDGSAERSPVAGPIRIVLAATTNICLFGGACVAAVYGVTYAYFLHQLVNGLCGWLLVLHTTGSDRSRTPTNEYTSHKKDYNMTDDKIDLRDSTQDEITRASGNSSNNTNDDSLDGQATDRPRSRRTSSESRRLRRDRKTSTDPAGEHRRSTRVKK